MSEQPTAEWIASVVREPYCIGSLVSGRGRVACWTVVDRESGEIIRTLKTRESAIVACDRLNKEATG